MATPMSECKGMACHCHRIRKGLYLGDAYAAHNEDFLRKYNINRIVNCAREIPIRRAGWNVNFVVGEPAQGGGDIKRLHLPIDDHPQFNISQYFGVVDMFISDGLQKGENVLVHCAAGISRSATVLAAHLMAKYKITDEEALQTLRAIRPQVNPNQGFRQALQAYYYKLNNQWGDRFHSGASPSQTNLF